MHVGTMYNFILLPSSFPLFLKITKRDSNLLTQKSHYKICDLIKIKEISNLFHNAFFPELMSKL